MSPKAPLRMTKLTSIAAAGLDFRINWKRINGLMEFSLKWTHRKRMKFDIDGKLYCHLITHLPFNTERRVTLMVIDPGFDYPLIVEGRKTTRLVIQLVHKLIRTVWLELQICKTKHRNRNSINIMLTQSRHPHLIIG